jgi:putative ABC transport system permease protein
VSFAAWRRLLYTMPLRLRTLFRRADVERDLDDELRFHVERQVAESIAQGMTPQAARQAALRDLRGIERGKEACRQVRKLNWVFDLIQDVRYGVRILRQRPAFTLIAVATLALGIGANSAIFSVVDAVLVRPLPYPQPQQLLTLDSGESLPALEDIQRLTRSFAGIGAYNVQSLAYTGEAEPLEIYGALCTADLFPVLGAAPLLGRAISAQDDRYGAARVALLTYTFWQSHFAGDAAVLGKAITLDGNPYTVIGVMPPDFWKPGRPVEVLVPVRTAYPEAARERGVHFLETFLRLKPGVSAARAQSDLDGASRWLASRFPEHEGTTPRRLMALQERVVGNVRPALLILFGAVTLVLLTACVNFASLLLARAASRQREILTRKALGAPTARLVRQMLAESIPLVVAGGGAGLLLAWWGVHLLAVLKPADLPRLTAVRIDGSVLAFTFGLCALTSVVFGALPALGGAARANLSDSLKAGARGSAGAATTRLRMLLVVAEVALALVLLVGAGLLVRSFHGLTGVAPGFSAEHVLTLRLELPAVRYRKLEPQRRFRQRLLEAVNALPGVQAAMISELPMSGDSLSHNFVIAGRPPLATGEEPELQSRTVAGNYFRVLRIPLLRGRAFAAEDHAGTAHVVVVNQAFVEQYFPHQDPVGARIAWARDTPRDWMTIIGVAGDVRHFGPAQPERPAAYDLYSQTAQDWKRWMFLVVRSRVAPAALRAEVNRGLGAIDNQIPPTEVQTMEEVAAAALARPRFNLTLMGIFAALALALAAIGIYGVTAYTVTQRTQEIGIRIALGARHRNVLTLLLGQCAWLTLTGAAIGTAAALGLTRLMASLLFGVTAQDPLTFAAVAALLVAVALLAALLPARRATRIDPVKALRTE